jgi:hypothetical protein
MAAALAANEHAETIAIPSGCASGRAPILGTTFRTSDAFQCRNPAIFLDSVCRRRRRLSKMSQRGKSSRASAPIGRASGEAGGAC